MQVRACVVGAWGCVCPHPLSVLLILSRILPIKCYFSILHKFSVHDMCFVRTLAYFLNLSSLMWSWCNCLKIKVSSVIGVCNYFLCNFLLCFSPVSYDLFKHNCNNFTNEVSQFLCGKGIPKYILDVPEDVLSTWVS